jgi:hypothetical protein
MEGSLLMCFMTGERNGANGYEQWQELIQKCQSEELSRIQITLALRGKLSPFEAIKSYQSIIEILKPANLKIALIDLNHLTLKDSQVACNMGASQGLNIAFFKQEEQAQDWLMSSDFASNDTNPVNRFA